MKIKKFHPDIKLDFFKEIKTKEQAYWLGIMYSDGYISKIRNNKIFGLKVGIKDEILVDNFIKVLGLNPTYKKIIDGNKVRIQVTCDEIVNDLENHGVVMRKSKIIELPKLESNELYLAFLLGYFDGDGTQGTTRITSGSYKFLNQIKIKFKIINKIRTEYTKSEIDGRVIYGKKNILYLGAGLFNEMLGNYTKSLPRKRVKFDTINDIKVKIKKKVWRSTDRKFKGTKEDLEILVWEKPMTKIAEKYGVSNSTIKKYCKKWGIKTPSQGYWSKGRKK